MTDEASETLTGADWTKHVEQQVTDAFDHDQLVVHLSVEERNKIRAAIDEVEGMPEGTQFVTRRGVRDQKGSVAILLWAPLADGTRVASFPIAAWDDRIEAATEGAIAVRDAYKRATG